MADYKNKNNNNDTGQTCQNFKPELITITLPFWAFLIIFTLCMLFIIIYIIKVSKRHQLQILQQNQTNNANEHVIHTTTGFINKHKTIDNSGGAKHKPSKADSVKQSGSSKKGSSNQKKKNDDEKPRNKNDKDKDTLENALDSKGVYIKTKNKNSISQYV